MNFPHNKSPHKGIPGKSRRTVFTVKEPSVMMSFLMAGMPGKSRNSVKSILAHGQVYVNNKKVTRHDHPLYPGQQVVYDRNIKNSEPLPEGLKILFEDSFIIVIEKKTGLLSVSTGARKEITAMGILNDHVKKIKSSYKVFPVHRLDRATSGVMLFAKSNKLQHEMRDKWMKIVSERTYVAVVEGLMKKEKDTIVSWLKEDFEKKMFSTRDSIHGKKAITHYKVLKKTEQYALLEIELETGRKNQIRVHMQDIGHSIAGDDKYGAKTDPLKRLGLHASVLAFQHPVTGEKVRFESPVPDGFYRLFKYQG